MIYCTERKIRAGAERRRTLLENMMNVNGQTNEEKKITETEQSPKAPVGARYETRVVKSAVPYWTAAAVWLVCALILPFHRIWAVLLAALLSAAAALIVKKVLPVETEQVLVPFASGDVELDAMVNELDRVRGLIDADRERIAERFPDAASRMSGISGSIGLIRDDVAAHPEDLRLIRRFMNYYLPTTVKMTDKYVFLSGQEESENVNQTRRAAEEALEVIDGAFKKQYDALFANDNLDITTDVKVLEAMIQRDNLK